MTRLILHTGRFRDMGYETAFSGAAPTAEERTKVDRLLAGLRRGDPEGGVGVVVKTSAAGRGIEEILALATPRPLLPASAARVEEELKRLQSDELPELIAAVGRAGSVLEGRDTLRRGLDSWHSDLQPLLALAPGNSGDAAPREQAARNAWFLWPIVAVVAAIVGIAVTLIAWPPFSAPHGQPVLAVTGPDECRPNGAEDDAEIDRLLGALEAHLERELFPGDAFAALSPEAATRLRPLMPAPAAGADVCRLRRALGHVYLDLAKVTAAAAPPSINHARAQLWEGEGTRFLDALEAAAQIALPDPDLLCTMEDVPCLDVFVHADAAILTVMHEAYQVLLGQFVDPALLRANDFNASGLEQALAESRFRHVEIMLRGELHRAGLGEEAAALLDPLRALADCPRWGLCEAPAGRKIWPDR